ncbi:efflux RND transporter periplasmic adaptor subunit [Roseicella aerolata]|uniref:Efflux RND transporter periplasmic adaptor subunit n=1 Tax=Roseicella aerolata TaxID=2883479 RepID=A0A9X1LBY7_9PROT|nr:efflux RND transporter periplasmic adaptor subunit [Roseicella aerolata]MCB4823675.1 efflux RND transporter periplasmic adaptor subunit [Roseicella aerolata]
MKSRHVALGLGVMLIAGAAKFPNPGNWFNQTSAAEPRYLTAPVERGDIRTTLSATGTLAAVVTVKVSSQLSGQIAEVLVDFNDKVTTGQPIARLDPSSFEARVRQAEAALETAKARVALSRAALERTNAALSAARSSHRAAAAQLRSAESRAETVRRDFERKRTLVDREVLPPSRGEDATSAHESAAAQVIAAAAELAGREAAIEAAVADQRMAEAQVQFALDSVRLQDAVLDQVRLDLAHTVIRSPIDGEIIGKDADRGQIVAASLQAPTLFTIARDLTQMELLARVDEADIGRIRIGQRALFAVDAVPGRAFGGRVTQIRKAPSMVQNVVTYTVVLAAPNPDQLLLPGMTAVAQIVVDEAADVLKIPNAALRFTPPGGTGRNGAQAAPAPAPGQAMVWVPGEGGAPAPVPVRLGRSNASATEILAGRIGPGQQVIVGTASAPASRSFFSLR